VVAFRISKHTSEDSAQALVAHPSSCRRH
jgi:hypothetical protein